eukprot:comp15747_c0_seq1/m.12955 comp15747_c0_seq1/g.12955  ORF comp15747_c0_seq1/g.12955 comp15747_c0_seq1/m.12955 type:complete len:767 (-) comp15747_c0_seq1:194-2494(-)
MGETDAVRQRKGPNSHASPKNDTHRERENGHLCDCKPAEVPALTHPAPKRPLHSINVVAFALVTALGFATRLYRLDLPHYVVFDEVHFGKFASYYLRGEYYFDVHPPLGKLLIALCGYLVGYDGRCLFDNIGEDYLTISSTGPIPYVALRFLPALLGALQIPLVYLSVIELGASNLAALLASSLLLFENTHVTQSRLILLDSFLLFFITWSFYAYVKFTNQGHRPFSFQWWAWLLATGVGLGCSVGVKYVGLFIIALVGLHTIHELWTLFTDTRNSLFVVWQHFISRAICLIVVPCLLFAGLFWIHFALLTHTGPGDAFMSLPFQATLIGNSNSPKNVTVMPPKVTYGSVIEIQNVHSKPPCYLHSHSDRYPVYYNKDTDDERVGTGEQQVTCYAHKDVNNRWMILEVNSTNPMLREIEGVNATDNEPFSHDSVREVKDGDYVKLVHMSTHKLLNGHDVASPMSPSKQEVSCWDHTETMAAEPVWIIRVTSGPSDHIAPFHTRFKIIHQTTRTTMELSGETLPEWAFNQAEVVSSKITLGTHEEWIVTSVEDERQEAVEIETVVPLLFHEKLAELVHTMLESNQGLTAKHVYSSRPSDWPFLVRGISYYHGDKSQIYLIGNPATWLVSHVLLSCFGLLWAWHLLRRARRCFDLDQRTYMVLDRTFYLSFGAYLLHYLPFFPMERQLFLHHYLPCTLFVFIATGVFLDFVVKPLPLVFQALVVSTFLSVAGFVFTLYAPLSYSLPVSGFEDSLKLRIGWDFKSDWDK